MDQLEPLLRRMEELIGALDALPETERTAVFELLDGIDVLHRTALTQLAGNLDPGTLERLRTGNDAVAWLFDAYGIGIDQRAAAERAVDEVRPYIHSHGGRVEIQDVVDGVVHVRMSGACAGCTASARTLTEGLEEALREHLPGFSRIEAEEDQADPHPPPVPVQIESRPPENWR